MKKILLALTLVAGFGLAANAQTTEKSTEATPDPAKVEVAGQVATEAPATDAVAAEPATTTTTESGTTAKACCSSKKGKETASAKTKSCCADGKKMKADCAEKKTETPISQ